MFEGDGSLVMALTIFLLIIRDHVNLHVAASLMI
jgi:hypothetical protein